LFVFFFFKYYHFVECEDLVIQSRRSTMSSENDLDATPPTETGTDMGCTDDRKLPRTAKTDDHNIEEELTSIPDDTPTAEDDSHDSTTTIATSTKAAATATNGDDDSHASAEFWEKRARLLEARVLQLEQKLRDTSTHDEFFRQVRKASALTTCRHVQTENWKANELPCVNHSGFLTKKKSLSGFVASQRRYCVLVGPMLYYYRDADEFRPRGVMELQGCSVRACAPHCLRLDLKKQAKSYYLLCENDTELDEWINAIADASKTRWSSVSSSSSDSDSIGATQVPSSPIRSAARPDASPSPPSSSPAHGPKLESFEETTEFFVSLLRRVLQGDRVMSVEARQALNRLSNYRSLTPFVAVLTAHRSSVCNFYVCCCYLR
jgi:PH domain